MDQPSFTFRAVPESRGGAAGFRVEVVTPDQLAVQSQWIDEQAWAQLQDDRVMPKFRQIVAAGASVERAMDKALGLDNVVSLALRMAKRFGFIPGGTWAEESIREAARVLNTTLSDEMVRRGARSLSDRVTRPIPVGPA